jgi:cytochrome c556
MMRTVVIVGTLLLGVGAVMAQEDALKHAQTFMKGNGKNAGALGAMVKGEKPYDQATVNTALAQFEDTAKNLPTLFPDSLKGAKWDGDYSPSPKIWEDKAGFSEHIVRVAVPSAGLKAAPGIATATPAFLPGSAGPWKCAAVALPESPE